MGRCNMKQFSRLLLVVASLCLFSGCPDYSHLRPAPDYKNMSDSAPEGSIGEEANKNE